VRARLRKGLHPDDVGWEQLTIPRDTIPNSEPVPPGGSGEVGEGSSLVGVTVRQEQETVSSGITVNTEWPQTLPKLL